MIHGEYTKLKSSLRYDLHGSESYNVLRAFDLAERLHQGTRKDNVTPEFAHQIWIASFINTLSRSLPDAETALIAALLHDSVEDAGLDINAVEKEFGKASSDAIWALTKIRGGKKLPDDIYYGEMAQNPVAAFVKGVDRSHNVGSMVGVFTHEKQRAYLEETQKFVLPLLKRARNQFPEWNKPILNVRHILISRVALIEHLLEVTN